jgi:hypothetical protein
MCVYIRGNFHHPGMVLSIQNNHIANLSNFANLDMPVNFTYTLVTPGNLHPQRDADWQAFVQAESLLGRFCSRIEYRKFKT